MNRLSQDKQDKIALLVSLWCTDRHIAASLEINPNTVLQYRKKHKLKSGKQLQVMQATKHISDNPGKRPHVYAKRFDLSINKIKLIIKELNDATRKI